MTREYLVVYEKGEKNWSAFPPGMTGCASMGEALEDTRVHMREALELSLAETVNAGEPLPEAAAASIDFTEFDPAHETKHPVVEWLRVPLPQADVSAQATQAA